MSSPTKSATVDTMLLPVCLNFSGKGREKETQHSRSCEARRGQMSIWRELHSQCLGVRAGHSVWPPYLGHQGRHHAAGVPAL
eukprot:1161124-Pelagomonas_calceolata.AAC.6